MEIKLVLNKRSLKHLINHLGEDRVTIINVENDGYTHISFEVNDYRDVLAVLHAGTDSGLELGLYGVNGKPEEKKVEEIVA